MGKKKNGCNYFTANMVRYRTVQLVKFFFKNIKYGKIPGTNSFFWYSATTYVCPRLQTPRKSRFCSGKGIDLTYLRTWELYRTKR